MPSLEDLDELSSMECSIAKNFIENNPNIWGEYSYIIVNITERGLFPIKFKDLDTATEVSFQLQKNHPYISAHINFKNREEDNSIVFGDMEFEEQN